MLRFYFLLVSVFVCTLNAQTTIQLSEAIVNYTSTYDEVTDTSKGGFLFGFTIDDDATMYISANRISYTADLSGNPPFPVVVYIDEYTGVNGNGISEGEEIFEYIFYGEYLYARVGASPDNENHNLLHRIVRIDVDETSPALVDITAKENINSSNVSDLFIEGDTLFYSDTVENEFDSDQEVIKKMNLSAVDPGETIETVYTATNDDLLSYTIHNGFLYTIEIFEDQHAAQNLIILKTALEDSTPQETVISLTTDLFYDNLITNGNHLFFTEDTNDEVYTINLTEDQPSIETLITFSDGEEGPFDSEENFFLNQINLQENVLYVGANNDIAEKGYVFAYELPEEFTLNSDKALLPQTVIYPNPAKTRVVVEGSVQEYKIYNLVGQEVLSGNFDADQQAAIDIHGLNSGVYLLKIDEKNVKKLVIED